MGRNPDRAFILRLFGLVFACCMFFSTPIIAKSKSAFVVSNNMDFSRMDTGQYTVEILLNGQGPFIFMIDSAATRTSIFEKTLSKLELPDKPAVEVLISGMTGARLRPIVTLKSLSLGKSTFPDHSVVILEDWDDQEERLDGILGIEVIKEFVLSFSHGENRLRIRNKFNPRAVKYKGWNKVSLISNPYPVDDYGLKFTGAKVGKALIPAMIDTGANFTTISWSSVKGTRLAKEKRRLREEWVVQGAVGEFRPRMVVKLDEILIGGIQLSKHEMLLMDFEQLQVNGKGRYPLIIAGIDLMGGRDFVLDLKNNALYVEPADRGWFLRSKASRLSQPYGY